MEEGERRLREYAQSSKCRIAMLNDVDGLVKNDQVGPEFGPGSEIVCSICKHACCFYAEICGSCPDNREARCVSHFGRKFRCRCRRAGHKPVLVRRRDPVLLGDLTSRLEDMAGVLSSSEKRLCRYVDFLWTWETPLRSSGLRLRPNLKLGAARAPWTIQQKENRRKKSEEKKAKKEKRRKPAKRAEQQRHKRGLLEDPDFDHVKKRRKSEVGGASWNLVDIRRFVPRDENKGRRGAGATRVRGHPPRSGNEKTR